MKRHLPATTGKLRRSLPSWLAMGACLVALSGNAGTGDRQREPMVPDSPAWEAHKASLSRHIVHDDSTTASIVVPHAAFPAPCNPADGTFTAFPANDDGSVGPIPLGFTFSLYGTPYTQVWVNNNGNLTFTGPFGSFTSSGFPLAGTPMVAPFWADVDTRAGNLVRYKVIPPNTFVATYESVGYYSVHTDKLDTFQVMISDGTNASMGLGKNVCFCYADMQWTTGDASGGSGGFGGVAATVGVNGGNGVDYVQLGRFDQPGAAYDGPFGNNDGVDYLDNRQQCYRVDQPPITCAAGTTASNGCNSGSITGATITDINGSAVTYNWTSSNPNVTVSPISGSLPAGPTGPQTLPTFIVTNSGLPCGQTATLTLHVTDALGALSACATSITFNDTVPPVLGNTVGASPANFVANGAAINQTFNGNNLCWRLTPALNSQFGTVWYQNRLSLADSFDFQMQLYFGTNDAGADGIAFVLQPNSTGAGSAGGGLGYQGITPSVDVEFDTFSNAPVNDPAADHVALQRNGDVNHPGILGPFAVADLENGAFHPARVAWVAATNTLTVTLDNVVLFSRVENFTGTTFGGNPNVYFGVTAATGGANNEHRVCFDSLQFVQLPPNQSVECNAIPAQPVLGATDNCDTNVAVTPSSSSAGNSCSGTVTYSWIARDDCNNTDSYSQVITYQDTQAPTITTPANNLTVECDGAGNAAQLTNWLNTRGGAIATDACNAVTWTNNFTGLSDLCGATGAATVTFSASDGCGHSRTTTATFTIEDMTNPTITTPAANLTVECDGAGNNAQLTAWLNSNGGAVATDTCSGAGGVTWTNNFTALSDLCGATGAATVTFTAHDACGRTSTTVATFTIEDMTNPTITTPAANLTVECDGAGNNAQLTAWLNSNGGAVASDTCSGAGGVTWTNNFTALSDLCGATGAATVTFTAHDACGRMATTTATFTIEDTVDPTITTVASDLTVECDGAGNNAHLTAWLNSNGDAVASDTCSGAGGVTWTNDFTALSDLCGATGAATVTFTAHDACGRTSTTTATFTIEDTVDPTITTVASDLTVECDGAGNTAELTAWLASNGGAVASDTCSGVTWTTSFTALSDDCGATGSATVTFTATDACGNASTTTATFTIEDSVDPTISTVASDLTVECDGTGNTSQLNAWLNSQGSAVASDICSSVTWTNNFTGLSDDCGATGSATVTFTATDDCGNASVTTATFTIEDTTHPAIDVAAADQTVECDGAGNGAQLAAWLSSQGGAVASDVCSSVVWTNDFTGLSDLCGATGSATVTFTATDDCGNASVTTATFTIVDTTNPSIDVAAADLTVECDGSGNSAELNAWLTAQGNASASDVCSSVTWSNDFTSLSDLCGATGAATVTFTATDDCGNASSTTATFTIEDTTHPVIAGVPDDETVECDSVPDPATPTASDVCSAATLDYQQDRIDGNCEDNYTLTRTWTSMDDCGNVTVEPQVITVQDTVDPTVTAVLDPVAPLPAQSANSAASVCSAPTSRQFRVGCAIDDNCDDMPVLTARLLSTQTEVADDGSCSTVVTPVDVECDQVVEIQLLASPCPANGPASAGSVTSVNSSGVLIVYGESVVLAVRGEDRCGNVAIDTFDPATEPSTLCDEILMDGTCCPAVGQPPSDCEDPCGPGVAGTPTQKVATPSAADSAVVPDVDLGGRRR